MLSSRRLFFFSLCLLGTAATIICPNGTISVNLQLNWFSQSEFSTYLVAHEFGYYAHECLTINVLTGGPQTSEVEEIISGRATFGIGWFSAILQAEDQGSNLTLVAQMFRRASQVLVTWRSSGLKSIPDLRNKKVCVWGNGFEHTLKMALNEYGLKWDDNWEAGETNGDVDIVLQDAEYGMSQFFSKECDAVSALRYAELGEILSTQKTFGHFYTLDDLNIIDYSNLGVTVLEDGIVVRRDYAAAHPDIVIRFLRASFKGAMWCRDHPLDVMSFFATHTAWEQYQLAEINKLLWPATPNGIGIIDAAQVQRAADIAFSFGLTSSRIDTSQGIFRFDLAQQAQQTLAQSGAQWKATSYGPGSTDYIAPKFVGLNPQFCLDANEVVIICPVPEHANTDGALIFFLIVLLLIIIAIVIGGIHFYRTRVMNADEDIEEEEDDEGKKASQSEIKEESISEDSGTQMAPFKKEKEYGTLDRPSQGEREASQVSDAEDDDQRRKPKKQTEAV